LKGKKVGIMPVMGAKQSAMLIKKEHKRVGSFCLQKQKNLDNNKQKKIVLHKRISSQTFASGGNKSSQDSSQK